MNISILYACTISIERPRELSKDALLLRYGLFTIEFQASKRPTVLARAYTC